MTAAQREASVGNSLQCLRGNGMTWWGLVGAMEWVLSIFNNYEVCCAYLALPLQGLQDY